MGRFRVYAVVYWRWAAGFDSVGQVYCGLVAMLRGVATSGPGFQQ